MAESKKSYPMLPTASWWELRKRFKQSIPGVVTDSYLATVLNMQLGSARGNVLPYLKQLGIIDEEGKTGERARLWRDDGHYSEVCKAILEEIYPSELLHAVPDPFTNRDQAERWFANATGTGQVAARRMASLYAVLVEADASKQPEKDKKEKRERIRLETEDRSKREKGPRPVASHAREAQVARSGSEEPKVEIRSNDGRSHLPGININLQIHISADATPDQIDQIFASMSKHIYSRG